MSIRGALSTMPAEDVLDWVQRKRTSCLVSFEGRGLVRTLCVDEGQVLWASSSRRNDQLGAIACRSGLISDAAVTTAVETSAETGVPLGQLLVMTGQVDEPRIASILATKIRETVVDVVSWRDGDYDVRPRAAPLHPGVDARISIEVCLAIASRRASRFAELVTTIGSEEAVFYVPESAVPPLVDADADDLDLRKVFALARERCTAGEIVSACGGERFAVFEALAHMIADGKVVVEGRQRARTNSIAELTSGAAARLRAGEVGSALELATQALGKNPGDSEARSIHAAADRSAAATLARDLLGRHRVPRLILEATIQGGLTEAEQIMLGRIDGCWDLLSLVRSSGIAATQALRAVARLAELGMVDVG